MLPEIEPAVERNLFHGLYKQLMQAWMEADEAILDELTESRFLFISDMVKNYHLDKSGWIDVLTNRFLLKEYTQDMRLLNVKDCVATVVSKMCILSNLNFSGLPHEYLVTDVWKCSEGKWRLLMRKIASLPGRSLPLI